MTAQTRLRQPRSSITFLANIPANHAPQVEPDTPMRHLQARAPIHPAVLRFFRLCALAAATPAASLVTADCIRATSMKITVKRGVAMTGVTLHSQAQTTSDA